MRNVLIVFLMGANLMLLGALLLGPGASRAEGQGWGGVGPDYMMFTAQIGQDRDAVYIVDLSRNRMAGLKLARAAGGGVEFSELRGVDFATDFRQPRN